MPDKVWLVDYDLPRDPMSRRVQFYRVKKRLVKQAVKENHEIRVLFSSFSVLLCNHEGLARNLSELAKDFQATSSHVYMLSELREVEEWLE